MLAALQFMSAQTDYAALNISFFFSMQGTGIHKQLYTFGFWCCWAEIWVARQCIRFFQYI